jgi:adenine-specific DNA-methyltransferase
MERLTTKREGLQVYCADALELLASLPEASVNLIATDPPYFRVKDEPWDRQWDKAEGFLSWLGQVCDELRRVLKPNGSLYLFASPQMASRVEAVVGERFNVLNSIRWYKDAGWYQKTDEETLRSYLTPWEAAIFAEQWGADHDADQGSGYGLACHFLHKDVFRPIGEYFQQERERAGLTRNEVEVALGYVSSADPTRGTALCCRWEEGSSLPSAEAYERYRALLNTFGGDFLPRPFEELKRTYAELREQYEALRSQYEALRRPFFASEETPYTDVWDFPTVQGYPGKHPCEKPLSLASHIVTVSSREGDTLLDPFCGSGVFGEAALRLGRKAILGDASDHWSQYAAAKLDRQFGALPVGCGRVKKPKQSQQPGLFAEVSA